jgi:TrmH family RNA methyltransferase
MTKSQIQFLQSLSKQKYRKEHHVYVVEGDKNAKEWLEHRASIKYIIASAAWMSQHQHLIALHPEAIIWEPEPFEWEKFSNLHTPTSVLLVVNMPTEKPLQFLENTWYLYLDRIQDPGNMGTLLRTADWFGITKIICSPDCVELYNPKVVQATMGSLLRLTIYTLDQDALVATNTLPLYATDLNGQNIYTIRDAKPGIIAIGNESQGVSSLIKANATHNILIPGRGGAESLNVAVATGIVCATLIQ